MRKAREARSSQCGKAKAASMCAAKLPAEARLIAGRCQREAGQAKACQGRRTSRRPAWPQSAVAAQQAAAVGTDTVVRQTGNNGELRSEAGATQPQPRLLRRRCLAARRSAAEHAAGDPRARCRAGARSRQQEVQGRSRNSSRRRSRSPAIRAAPSSSIPARTSSISSNRHRSARRYAIAVGREGLQFKGTGAVGDKQEWPRWIPTHRDAEARAEEIRPVQGRHARRRPKTRSARAPSTSTRARRTRICASTAPTQPQTIGTNSSNGCFRMINEHVMDLYSRVRVGTQVIIHLTAHRTSCRRAGTTPAFLFCVGRLISACREKPARLDFSLAESISAALSDNSHGAICIHHRRRGFLPWQRHCGSGSRRAAAGARLSRAHQQARPLSQRRSRHDVALPAWRGVRDRRRRGDRPRSRPLRALHRPLGQPERQHHHRPHLQEHHRARAARRLSRRDRAGHPARHRRDQEFRPSTATTTTTSCSARSAARSATSRRCRSSRRSASSATTCRATTPSTST